MSRYREVQIHPSAVVDQGAKIGSGSRIWHFTHISERADVGKDVSIGQNVFIANDVKVGDNCKIQNNVSVYEGVTLEYGVFCGPSCVFTNVQNPRAEVVRKSEFKATRVCRGVTLGANSTIVCGVTLGAYAFIGAGAVVTEDVKPYALMVGVPAKQVGWMSAHGERLPLPLQGEAQCACKISGGVYRVEEGSVTFLEP